MNASELATLMLDWEKKRQVLDALESTIEMAVKELGKSFVVGNIHAIYYKGRVTTDWEGAAKVALDGDEKLDQLIEEHSRTLVDWKAVYMDHPHKDFHIESFQSVSEPSVVVKIDKKAEGT